MLFKMLKKVACVIYFISMISWITAASPAPYLVTASPSTPKSTVNASGCGSSPADIVFILDSSGSVEHYNFEIMKKFVITLVNKFDIGPSHTQIGVITFSSEVQLQFHLNTYHSEAEIETAIDQITYTNGGTNTADAIKCAREKSFTNANGARTNASKIAIIITDGKSDNNTATTSEAQRLRNKNVTVFSIGVGSNVNVFELKQIATDNLHFSVKKFEGLRSELVKKIYKDIACKSGTESVNASFLLPDATGGRCQENGTWRSGTKSKCELKCPHETKSVNASGLLTHVSGYTVNQTLNYTCDHSLISGNLERKCQENGTWSGDEPVCGLSCPHETKSINASGLLTHVSGYTVNQTLNYACDRSLISGNLERKCQENGTWSGDEPVCGLSCPHETKSINASGLLAHVSGYTVNQTLNYTCDHSLISGNLERKCQENGTWSGDEPVCGRWCRISKQLNETQFKEMLNELKIDIKKTSRFKRAKTSAPDTRRSSKVVGNVAIGVMVTIVAVVVIPDLLKLLRYIMGTHKKFKFLNPK